MRTKKFRSAMTVAAATAVAAVPSLALTPAQPAQAASDGPSQMYIVELDSQPIATYDGGEQGLSATKPTAGRKVDTNSPQARAYGEFLREKHDETLKESGASPQAKKIEYKVAFNGYAAELTPTQVMALRAHPDVKNVWINEIHHAEMISTPDYLGLTGRGGVWQQQFGGEKNAGQGIIVGVIDTGIDSHHPFFAPTPGATPNPKFKGVCDKGEDPNFTCSSKIIGARYYGPAYGNTLDRKYEPTLSPTDRGGHGSHTAGTSAGNYNVPASIKGYDLGRASGVAPAAQISVYKALWENEKGGSGTTAGLVAAIDDATADGVDVINYSVSGSSTSVIGPEAIAQLNATEAGVFFSASAGNSGDKVGPGSVAHVGPWTMTVAASSHDRAPWIREVTLGNGEKYQGSGIGKGVGPAPLINAAKAGLPGADPTKLRQCFSDGDDKTAGVQALLDPAKVAGKIVICDRGGNDRTNKSEAVKAAGGVGLIHTNTQATESVNSDYHVLPTIHVDNVKGDAIKAYEASATAPTATIGDARPGAKPDAPSMAYFSSYGPAIGGRGDLIKPDITAPGMDIISAVSAGPNGEPRWDSYQGTSMSAPHIAGLAALMKQKNPSWTPDMIKSAMMTTARTTTDAGKPIMAGAEIATPLNYGAGEVVPMKMTNPGLVYKADFQGWRNYACGIYQWQQTSDGKNCPAKLTDPSDLNYPTIGIGDLAGKQVVKRTVTNVGGKISGYQVKVDAPKGTKVSVFPAVLVLAPGTSQSYWVTIERTNAELGQYTHGAITWTDQQGHSVRSNISVRPTGMSLPEPFTETGRDGKFTYPVTFAVGGRVDTKPMGLLPSTRTTLKTDTTSSLLKVVTHRVEVPAGTRALRFATYKEDTPALRVLMVLNRVASDGTQQPVAVSLQPGADQSVLLENPEPGTYELNLQVLTLNPTQVNVHSWMLNDQPNPNLTVTPKWFLTSPGMRKDITMQWKGLAGSKHYFGGVNFVRDGKVLGSTFLTVNT